MVTAAAGQEAGHGGQATTLAGFDGSDEARRAVAWAARDARSQGRRLVIARAYEPRLPAAGYPSMVPAEDRADEPIRHAASELLDELAAEIGEDYPGVVVATAFRDGPPAAILSELAREFDAALLVLGACGLSAIPRMLLGSVAAEMAHVERRPVVVVRGEQPHADAPVVLGVDGSPNSYRAIGFAFDFAARHGCDVHAVHAWSDLPLTLARSEPPTDPHVEKLRSITDQHIDTWHEQYPKVGLHWGVADDRPANALLERANGARLVVVGSHGRGPIRRALLGSVSHAVLHNAECPVAVLRELDSDEAR